MFTRLEHFGIRIRFRLLPATGKCLKLLEFGFLKGHYFKSTFNNLWSRMIQSQNSINIVIID